MQAIPPPVRACCWSTLVPYPPRDITTWRVILGLNVDKQPWSRGERSTSILQSYPPAWPNATLPMQVASLVHLGNKAAI